MLIIELLLFIIILTYVVWLRICDKSYIGGASKTKFKDLIKHPRSKSEALAIKILTTITGHEFPTAYPDWCVDNGVPMELDGYNKTIGVALEFSGPQHYKWFPQNESYQEYFKRIRRDKLKEKLCETNGICLIILEISLNKNHWSNYLKSRLYDCNKCTKPYEYIPMARQEVFRNYQIEKELDLNM